MYLEGGNRARAGKEKEKEISENELCLKNTRNISQEVSKQTDIDKAGRQADRQTDKIIITQTNTRHKQVHTSV